MAFPRFGSRGRSHAVAILLGLIFLATVLTATSGATAAGPGPVIGNCFVSGPINSPTARWDASCIWVMTANVTVMPPATLTIDPGVSVKANPRVSLYVRGALLADGALGKLITFAPNNTLSAVPWGGVQFNATSRGSVSFASFSRAERAIHAIQSSPPITNNVIDTSYYGILLEASSASVLGNQINYTNVGVQASTAGDVTVAGNTFTNMTGNPALAIYGTNLQSVSISSNTIRDIVATNGRTPAVPGGRGTDGGYAVGILVNGTTSATIDSNVISRLVGGQGGSGAANASGNGGRGGDGGSAGGIITFGESSVSISSNTISGLAGGRGGDGGGSSAPTGSGGNGGNGGSAAGVETIRSATSAVWSFNLVSSLAAGSAGDGGPTTAATGSIGNGGVGGDVHGFLTVQAMNGDSNWNTVQSLRGGYGGNSSGARGASGGNGGQVAAFWAFGVDGSGSIHDNTFTDLTGGAGGSGRFTAGAGGDATGVLAVGDGNPFNLSALQRNDISVLTGGAGGLGTPKGGTGGMVTGVAAFHVRLDSTGNTISSLTGGKGADAIPGPVNVPGRGGDSTAFIAALVPAGASSSDTIRTVAKGAAGAGSGGAKSYGVGIYAIGNATTRTRLTITNGTLSGISDLDIHVDNYTGATTVNTTFSATKLAVETAGNLTVRNFLDVKVYWPNNSTLLGGASVRVDDDGVQAWNAVTPTGQVQWLIITDRVYIRSATTIHDNQTKITVSYTGATFWSDPRLVNMGTSHTEPFGMIDATAPTSSASPLPTYENSRTFGVGYTYSDGNGVGVKTVSLWYRTGAGAWTSYAIQLVPNAGNSFTFTATSDGTYQFYTTATDNAGNSQTAPVGDTGNNTWTIVDTVSPSSRVNPLASYQNALSFVVSWSPDPGVTDILAYTIQYNSGSGWIDWLANTHATSGTFTAGSDGAYAFRSIATDRAGNVEAAPSGNDTWTVVDVTRPFVTNAIPVGGEISTTPLIAITFSEPMNRTSVEGAFSGGAGINGTFVWSADSRMVTFLPSRSLQAGTTYTIVINTNAKDLAGNQMLAPLTYQFSTLAAAPAGLALADFWWLFAIIAAAVGGALLLVMRRRPGTASEPPAPAPVSKTKEAIIEDLFLLYHRDGLLIKHETRRLRPDVDMDILSGMLTAVQAFVKDALRGDDSAELNEMTVGQMHIIIGRGKWLVLAARIEGDGTETWTGQIERCIKDMEDHHWDQLEDWDGEMGIARVLAPYLKKLIQGGYVLGRPIPSPAG